MLHGRWAAAWDAIVAKGGAKSSQPNLINMVTALNEIGDPTSITPIAIPDNPTVGQNMVAMEALISQIYEQVSTKGGTLPSQKNMQNLADAILSIPTGDYGTILYTNGNLTEAYHLASQEELNACAHTSTSSSAQPYTISVGGLNIPSENVVGFDIGADGTLPTSFLEGCTGLTTLIGQENIKAVPDRFLMYCYSFDQPITIPEGVKTIGYYFLYGCKLFNSVVTLPSTLRDIGRLFIYDCAVFDQPIAFPEGLTYIPEGALSRCAAFNSSVTIPSTVTTIETSFLKASTKYNQPLTLPSRLTTINGGFLDGAQSFSQSITIPSTVTTVKGSFMRNAMQFTGPLDISQATANGMTASNTTLANTYGTAASTPLTTVGVTITGSGAATVLEKFPNHPNTSTSPNYPRNLKTA